MNKRRCSTITRLYGVVNSWSHAAVPLDTPGMHMTQYEELQKAGAMKFVATASMR